MIAILLMAGIGYAILSNGSSDTEDTIKLPSYAYSSSMTLKAYKYATQHPEILEQIPCYCGCGNHSDHKHVRDCYIRDNGEYTDHASFCDVCIGIVVKVHDYLSSGMTLEEAREKIDNEYGKKYPGKGTDTSPMIDDV